MAAARLDYQNEIALRHTPARKNVTDGVDALPRVPLRYMVGFIYPVTMSVRPYLSAGGRSAEEVDAMFAAWFKPVTLQEARWTQAYSPTCCESGEISQSGRSARTPSDGTLVVVHQ